MSRVLTRPAAGTPTWIDLQVADPDRASAFYREVFGWEQRIDAAGRVTCLLNGHPVAGISAGVRTGWTVSFSVDDCETVAGHVVAAGGKVLDEPAGGVAVVEDVVGARFGLWEGRESVGCELVNEPNSLVRNDLVTPNPAPARAFYAAVFGYTLDRNPDMPGFDFSFLRLPDGHEIGGIMGMPDVLTSVWNTTIEVADTDDVIRLAAAAGAECGEAQATPYGRMASFVDPFGAEVSVIARPE
jgi:predicted enzyme related to lactoylglutathione lyase